MMVLTSSKESAKAKVASAAGPNYHMNFYTESSNARRTSYTYWMMLGSAGGDAELKLCRKLGRSQ